MPTVLDTRRSPKEAPTGRRRAAALAERRISRLAMPELRVDGARWLETNDFTKSGPDDRHYVFDRESGEIHFGDGKNGAVPAAGANLELDVGGAVIGTGPNLYRLTVPHGGTVVIHTRIEAQDESGGAHARAKRVGCLTAILGALAAIVALRSRK